MEDPEEILLCNSIKEEDRSKYIKKYYRAIKREDGKTYLEDLIIAFIHSMDEESFKDLKKSTLDDYELSLKKIKLRLKSININDLF